MRLLLRPEPLTRAAFAPFGDVIEAEGAAGYPINEGTTFRFHDLARVDVGDARPIVSIFRGQPRPPPLAVRMLERHPLGSQAFMPLQPRDWFVVVAPPGEVPEPERLRAFRASGSQGVNYAPGVWHHPLLVLWPDSDFLVIDRAGEDNLEEFSFDAAVALEAD